MKKEQYLLPNLINGTKLNESHFRDWENANIDMVSKTASSWLNEYNYGLLPLFYSKGENANFFLSIDSHQIQLNIQEFRALTLGGYLVEFDKDTAMVGNNLIVPIPNLSSAANNFREEVSSFYIVLTVNPFQRVPYGAPDPTELPCRIPYTLPAYYLDLVPAENPINNVIGKSQLPLGKLLIKDRKASLDKDYIPPCGTVNSHPALSKMHARLEQFFNDMENYSSQIIRRIIRRKQSDKLGEILQKLCERINDFIATEIADIGSLGKTRPPIYLINRVSSFARLITNTLNYYKDNGREEFINHCVKWCAITQGELESYITDVYMHQYNHLDIRNSDCKLTHFTEVISNLFSKLAELENISDKPNKPIIVVDGETKGPKRKFLGF